MDKTVAVLILVLIAAAVLVFQANQPVIPSGNLSAQASASPTGGVAPLTVRFTGSAFGGVPPYSYFWTFGANGGAESSQESPSYTYQSFGSFVATLTVTDSAQNSSSSSVTITVSLNTVPSTTLAIVVPDAFASDQTLQQYVTLRSSQGYKVVVGTTSAIESSFPYDNNQNYLLVSNVQNVQSSTGGANICYYDGTYFHVFATNYGGLWLGENTTTPQKAIIWTFQPSSYVTFSHDGYQQVNLNTGNYYVDWGLHYILANGSIYLYHGLNTQIHDWAAAQGASYLMLIGDLNLIPSFQMMGVGSGCRSFEDEGVTDIPYSLLDLNNPSFSGMINVGRVPISTQSELDAYFTKVISYVPHSSGKSYLNYGNGLGSNGADSQYQQWVSTMSGAVRNVLPSESIDDEFVGTTGLVDRVNTGYDYFLVCAHGYYGGAGYLDESYASQYQCPTASIFVCVACNAADFSRINTNSEMCLGEVLINDLDSKIVAFIGGGIEMYADYSPLQSFLSGAGGSSATVGSAMSYGVVHVSVWQTRFTLVLFGDPTLPIH